MRAAARVLPVFVLAVAAACGLAACGRERGRAVVVVSKNFTEQAVLGELLAQHIEHAARLPVERRFYMAGTFICQQALLAGRADVYVEYTGTALTAVLKDPPISGTAEAFERVRSEYARRWNLVVLPSLGFDNTFAVVVRGADARRLKISTLSQAAQYAPQWRMGVGYEFRERPDGYAGLVKTYGLTFREPPRLMDLGLLYRALTENQVDLAVGNSTDGLISALDLVALADDKHYFPPYDAVPIVRQAALDAFPGLRAALDGLAGRISAEDMRRMNYAVDGEHRDISEVVREFLLSKGL
ncbi:MAG TPA: glycine betaine ABC transporter substrate-binding protein [Candidatus Acidoferrales bacterium]|nr:glycine betaine ABC transporter substrate-binding protein [Candidatus Acidoferrales bacterium]